MLQVTVTDFADWRKQARALLQRGVKPEQLNWNAPAMQLFGDMLLPPITLPPPQVDKEFLSFATTVSCHRDPARWEMLYAALWRVTHGEKHLLQLATDTLVHRLKTMEKQVRRDAHKAKAFVRFRQTMEDGQEHFIAWHEPDHRILPIVTPFFARRFATQLWTIMTPDGSVHWNGEAIEYGPPSDKSHAPQGDVLEDLWRDYYRAIFNPARIKIKMMKSEMPVRYWHNLPETSIIEQMLEEAPERVERMLAHQEGTTMSAAQFIPEGVTSLQVLREAAKGCEGCPLYKNATQTVFGTGAKHAPFMLVGEQPGDEEDRTGKPFIGPAGRLLEEILDELEIPRAELYITNAVKHFGFTLQGMRRIHATPKASHVTACKPWLESEIALVKPSVILALGATAGKALLGPGFTLKLQRGVWSERGNARVTATWHPSAILRAQGEERGQQRAMLKHDIEAAFKKSDGNYSRTP